ncbi:MAG: hypothetical protein EB132_05240 [Actinobacteria bacterium]|nr:hypothetical protein [Actinomycetota bacterium]
MTSSPSLFPRADTTGFFSLERIIMRIPCSLSMVIPMPSPRSQITNSSPFCETMTLLSVKTPSKSKTMAWIDASISRVGLAMVSCSFGGE